MGYLLVVIGIGLLAASINFLLKEDFTTASLASLGSLLFFILGIKQIQKGRRKKIKEVVEKKVDTMVTERKVPIKRCPNTECSKEIKVHAEICPFCGYEYQIFYALTVYPPSDTQKYAVLVSDLTSKTGMPEERIRKELERGMTFRYSNRESLFTSKRNFEDLGCKTTTIHSLTVFMPENDQKRYHLIKDLSTKTGKSIGEITIELEKGKVFRYSSVDSLSKSKRVFEDCGCKVVVGEFVPPKRQF